MDVIEKYKGQGIKRKMSSQEIAEISGKLCDLLEKLEFSQNQELNIDFSRSEALLICYELQKILQNQFLGRKYARVSQNNLKFLNQIKERIEKQENILLEDGQGYLVEANLDKLKSVYKAIKNEEFFDELDGKEMQNQLDKLVQNMKISIDYCKDTKIKQKAQQYIDIVKNKKSFAEIDGDQNLQGDIQKQLELKMKKHIQYMNSQVSDGNSDEDSVVTEENEEKISIQETNDLEIINRDSSEEQKQNIDLSSFIKNDYFSNEQEGKRNYSHQEQQIQMISQQNDSENIKNKLSFLSNSSQQQICEKQQLLDQQMLELQQIKDAKLDEELLKEKQEAINKIAQDIELLNQIQHEINDMVVQNGETIDEFNKELEGVLETTKQTNVEIKQAYYIQQQLRRKKIRAFFVGIGGVLGFGLGGGIGTAIGTAGGAYLGKGIGKLLTKGSGESEDEDQSEKSENKLQEEQKEQAQFESKKIQF